MSMTTIPIATSKTAAWTDHVRDLIELSKPRISSMVLVSVALSIFVASGGQPNLLLLLHTLLGTALVAASSSAFNQWLERDRDRSMKRTANRPLPSGRLSGAEVIAFGSLTLTAGLVYLVCTAGWPAAGWALATWIVYVCIYTPMKSKTNWNTTVGAISGALPVLIGWSATGAPMSWPIAAMVLVLFVWQFPHFIAIAWIYRNQYGKAGHQMITVTDPSGQKPGVYAALGAIVVIGVSFLPLLAKFSVVYCVVIAALGIYQAVVARQFQIALTDQSARKLLVASIIYLPLALGMMAAHTVF